MRVLMFGWEFPPYRAGGLATATLGLVKGLVQRGVDVTLVVPFPVTARSAEGARLLSATEVAERYSIVRVDSPLVAYTGAAEYLLELRPVEDPPAMPAPKAVYGRDLMAEVDRFAAVAARVAAIEPHDVIDSHDWITFAAGLRARGASSRPLIAHIHATEYDRAGDGANPAILAREWEGLHGADRVIANSHQLARRVTERFHVPGERVDVIHWGVDGIRVAVDEARANDRLLGSAHPVLLFIGRVTWQKGPRYFVDVARRVADYFPNARFVVVGEGDSLPDMIQYAADVGVGEQILFAGGVEGPDVDRAYRMADVCVMPSVSEPFGLVALESLRNGTPCIVPRESGVAEVLENVFKIDFWDIEEMTNTIVALARYPALKETIREQGLAEIASPRLGLDEPARRTEAVYRRVVNGLHHG
ncbi:MAG TPA: glycosyltransferase family 4 protein [Gemmatimonadaceae bacterium]|nr:glycosyltransferase family 4 protein [Gemmatimonadaceae bacterium]